MKSARIANRYARALYSFAREKYMLENTFNDMLLLEKVCAESKDLTSFLSNPVLDHAKKSSVFKAIFAEKLSPSTFYFLEILLKKRREMVVREIAHEFIQLYRAYHNIKTVYFKTAAPATEQNIIQLKELLSRKFSSKIELVTDVNENLIGGFVMKVDDLQYDASVRRNITRLKKEYNVNIYIPKF